MPKGARYTLGARIENYWLDLLEQSFQAYFSVKHEKYERITQSIASLDLLKFLISVAWEAKYISHKQCESLVVQLEEIGKMLGGWQKSTAKQKKP
ncbi:MAG: diversity-generating retroelement protein bAvd family protein [Candidatus Pacebacteria bacterium CG10_big_fil_rev_8_21_14_0_10_45_6]|nr:MAG: diversity-generating retroelement protein bAvd family protein [Candidatus Pacebacteria bacterium CG10_big_fil_rev_8_21_14_0_10_45_6]